MSSPEAAETPLDFANRRIRDLEARLEESEETLDAIRRGDIDAVVVTGNAADHRVYTLENADRPYRVLIEQIQEGAVTVDAAGTVFYANRRLADLLGVAQERIVGQSLLPFFLPADRPAIDILAAAADRGSARGEFTLVSATGAQTPIYASFSLLPSDTGVLLLCGIITDLTQQKLHVRALSEANARLVAESEQRRSAEDALRQSQKMEAVGQLTGGLAHDFNNLLTGIVGSLELLRTRVAQGRLADLDRHISAAEDASRRAAALTHRLLAFARRQTLDPKPTEINRLVSGMEEMLRRTMGPRIEVEVVAGASLWNTLVDPNQLENALLNLCINARDAMPEGGRLAIETSNRSLDEATATSQELPPGDYVLLQVQDTGAGMAPEVVARAFDPFFTTKPIGQGTGLGLSMIYGFARQSGGQVGIASTVGRGATVTLYLPRHLGDVPHLEPQHHVAAGPAHAPRGDTVLVVDDEPTIRMLVRDVLEDSGYTAIEAWDGPSGLQVIRSDARIDLLITDVGLPGPLNGRQVADAARAIRPALKTLFITGYAESAGLDGTQLEPGMQILTKPFALDTLVRRVRDLIALA